MFLLVKGRLIVGVSGNFAVDTSGGSSLRSALSGTITLPFMEPAVVW